MESEALNKITARYNFREDRITIDGVIHTGQQLQILSLRAENMNPQMNLQ